MPLSFLCIFIKKLSVISFVGIFCLVCWQLIRFMFLQLSDLDQIYFVEIQKILK